MKSEAVPEAGESIERPGEGDGTASRGGGTSAGRRPTHLQKAEARFRETYPRYASTDALDELRARDYARLDAQDQVYLDYAGGSLHGESQLRAHMAVLSNSIHGNPHSVNPTSGASTALVEAVRAQCFDTFMRRRRRYTAIFTANASGALKLVGEVLSLCTPGGRFLLTVDNHNSVNGIREFARAKGGRGHVYVPVTPPEMSLEPARLLGNLDRRPGRPQPACLSRAIQLHGRAASVGAHRRAHRRGAGTCCSMRRRSSPTNRLGSRPLAPDFVTVSFYKIFGYPTGVGCLLARRAALPRLNRPWFAGGTIFAVAVQGDGTIMAGGCGGVRGRDARLLKHPGGGDRPAAHRSIGDSKRSTTGCSCLAGWLLENLTRLRHSNGRPRRTDVWSPNPAEARRTIALNFSIRPGRMIDYEAGRGAGGAGGREIPLRTSRSSAIRAPTKRLKA